MTPIEQGLAAIRATVAKIRMEASAGIDARNAALPDADELDTVDIVGQIGALAGAIDDCDVIMSTLISASPDFAGALRSWDRSDAMRQPGAGAVLTILEAIVAIQRAEDEIREAVASLERVGGGR